MSPKVVEVIPNEDFTLFLKFDNGETRVFDMKEYLDIGIFKELSDYSLFKTVKPFMGTIQWIHEQDLCLDTLYLKSKKIPKTNALRQPK